MGFYNQFTNDSPMTRLIMFNIPAKASSYKPPELDQPV